MKSDQGKAMSFSKAEFDDTADKSLLTKTGDPDTSESTQNLLSETNQSFKDWLGGLDVSQASSAVESPNKVSQSAARAGEINFEGTLTVNGYLAGLIFSPEGTLVVSEKGRIDGDILVKSVVIHGSVRGDIHATRKIELASPANVIGDIETVELVIQPGAVFEGRCVFTHSAENDQPDLSQAAAN
jgi:cytoskeletal protein CcmA (bactofilin family)